ncbi:MAG TPA: lipoprotein insertase outer membrane protein LolB [Gammaproteobacteria bacterium]|nr:lipoprotein insertase outer membrane protein LolB [Gammaproteobacteria bacterium]
MIPALRSALLAIGALAVSACATLSGHAPMGAANEFAWQARVTTLTALDNWELSGRVGVVNGKEGGSGSLDWDQNGDELHFDFRGPLGAGAVHIEGDSAALHVRSSRGDDFVTTDPEDDFARHLHMPMPVFSMRYWMLGVPDPGAPYSKVVDTQGEPLSLSQRGWQVDYQEYADVGGRALPVRFTLSRGAVRIKVAVSQWTLAPAAVTKSP